MTDLALSARAADFLYREANFLDQRMWNQWLGLYDESVCYWVPAWKNENEHTSNPNTEVSLIYYEDRGGLEDRIWRVESERSIVSTPLLRTLHLVSNVSAWEGEQPGTVATRANWSCHIFNPKRQTQHVFFGRYEYLIRNDSAEWKITKKTVFILNDYIPTMVDFYCL